MSATRFAFKLYLMHIIAERRKNHPYVLFIGGVDPSVLSTDCEFFLPIETVDKSDSWGYHYPACNQQEVINLGANQKIIELKSCEGCSLYQEGAPLDLSSLKGGDPDKVARRKARREARKAAHED